MEYAQLNQGPNKQIGPSCANELGHLANGVGAGMPSGTDTIRIMTYRLTHRLQFHVSLASNHTVRHERVRFTIGCTSSITNVEDKCSRKLALSGRQYIPITFKMEPSNKIILILQLLP
jgi:hypothetical protein